MPNLQDYALPIGIGIAVLILVIAIILSGYVKAPPDVAFIISGPRKKKKILIGRAGVRIPFIERKDILLLKQISIDIKTNGFVPTNDFIGVDIDAVAKVRVKTDPEGIELAMKNFLNMNEEKICAALTDSLQGNMREIIGTVGLRELNTDRKKFGDEMQNKAQTDMNALGIEIISCNIQRIDDENGLIIALGQDNMSQIQKDASIAKAQADRDVAIAVAEAKQKANEASVQSDIIIAERNNDLAIKQANLKVQADTLRLPMLRSQRPSRKLSSVRRWSTSDSRNSKLRSTVRLMLTSIRSRSSQKLSSSKSRSRLKLLSTISRRSLRLSV